MQYENEVVDVPVVKGRRDPDAQETSRPTLIQYIDKIVGVAPGYNSSSARHDRCSRFTRAEGRPVDLSQVQHTEGIIDGRAVVQHQTPAIRTVQETVTAELLTTTGCEESITVPAARMSDSGASGTTYRTCPLSLQVLCWSKQSSAKHW